MLGTICNYTQFNGLRHYDNTYKDFQYKDFTCNINKCDIA